MAPPAAGNGCDNFGADFCGRLAGEVSCGKAAFPAELDFSGRLEDEVACGNAAFPAELDFCGLATRWLQFNSLMRNS
jgi:hypothetical protein